MNDEWIDKLDDRALIYEMARLFEKTAILRHDKKILAAVRKRFLSDNG